MKRDDYMIRGQVMRVLGISAATTVNWRKSGKLKAKRMPNGLWNYDPRVVYSLKLGGKPRVTAIYARVSTYKQKADLHRQVTNLENYAAAKGWKVDYAYSDIASGIVFDKRKNFFRMLKKIENGKIDNVLITHKDRLSRVGFDLFRTLFNYHDCKITVLSDVEDPKEDKEEIFSEIIALLHCFSMKMYSQRRTRMKKILTKAGADTKATTTAERDTGRPKHKYRKKMNK